MLLGLNGHRLNQGTELLRMMLDFTLAYPLPEYAFLLGHSPVVEGSKVRFMHAKFDRASTTPTGSLPLWN